MNSTYYIVRIAIKGEMVVGTALEIVQDFAKPYDKVWYRDEYTFKEMSFDNLKEAQECQKAYDQIIGIDWSKYRLDLTGEKAILYMAN